MGLFDFIRGGKAINAPEKTAKQNIVSAGTTTDFILSIEDTFTIAGVGIVATGQVQQGIIAAGSWLNLNLPSGQQIPVFAKKLEAFKKNLNKAEVGAHIGVVLEGVQKESIVKGSSLTYRSSK